MAGLPDWARTSLLAPRVHSLATDHFLCLWLSDVFRLRETLQD